MKSSGTCVAAAALLIALPGLARAAEPELTPEELKALEESLGPSVPTPAPVPTSAPSGPTINLALGLDVAGAWFSEDEPEQLGGHDPARTGFTLQQLELYAGANVDPFFRLDSNLVFGEEGVEVEEAYATTLALPAGLQMRAGQFLTRFGKRNPTHPHAWAFLDQALPIGKFFGPDGARGLGLEVSWLVPLPWYLEVVATAQGASGECCARSFFGAEDPGIHGPEDFLYTFALKQFFDLSDAWALQWGLSAMLGPNASGGRTSLFGTDLFLRWKRVAGGARASFDILIEALLRIREVPSDVLRDWGTFAELRWQLDAEWAFAGRYEAVSGLAHDPLDVAWTGLRQRGALAVDLTPSHFARVRLQGGIDIADWKDEAGGFVMLGLSVGIGAHAAHSY